MKLAMFTNMLTVITSENNNNNINNDNDDYGDDDDEDSNKHYICNYRPSLNILFVSDRKQFIF